MKRFTTSVLVTAFIGMMPAPVFSAAWIQPEGQLQTSLALTSAQISGFYVERPRVALADLPGFTGAPISIWGLRYEGAFGSGPQEEVSWTTRLGSRSEFMYGGITRPSQTYLGDTRISRKHQFFQGQAVGATEFGIGIPGSYLRNSFSFEGMRDFEVFANILVAHQGKDGFSTSLDFGHYWRLGLAPNAFHLKYYAGQIVAETWRVYGMFDYWLDLEGDSVTPTTIFRDKNDYFSTRQIQDRLVFGVSQTQGDWQWGLQYSSVFSGENVPIQTAISLYTSTATFL